MIPAPPSSGVTMFEKIWSRHRIVERPDGQAPHGARHTFDVDPFARHCLLNGVDELGYTLSRMDEILAFERANSGSESK